MDYGLLTVGEIERRTTYVVSTKLARPAAVDRFNVKLMKS